MDAINGCWIIHGSSNSVWKGGMDPSSPFACLVLRCIAYSTSVDGLVICLYVNSVNHHLLTPEPPPPTRPVTWELQRELVASEDFPYKPRFIAFSQCYRAPPIPHAHTAIFLSRAIFSFYASTTSRDRSVVFLVHPHPPYPGRPTHHSVPEQRTRYCDIGP